jgi:hypothetical protein
MQSQDITTTLVSFATGFSSSNPQTSTSTVTLITTEQADIHVNHVCLRILMEGAIYHQEGSEKDREVMFNVLLMITKEHLGSEEEGIQLKCARTDIDVMRHFTECYLTHQENIKIERPSLFDADMYITAKLLLLDIREWQVGQVIYKAS